jgi:hypothetical protein
MGTWMTNCTDWNYIDVRDFEILKNIYNERVNHDTVDHDIQDLGIKLQQQLGLNWPFFDSQQSQYMLDLYDETINLGLTYYKQ